MDQGLLNVHQDLIIRCKAGEEQAHFQLYKVYSRAMFNVAYRIVNDEDEAQDVLQESFISAFKNLDYYRGDASFGAWLKRIVVNKALNVLQKRKFDPIPDDEHWDVAEDMPEEFDGSLTVERVRKAILELPDGYRAVLSLYLLEGYDHQEIAEIMNISESTSKSQLNRAKTKLREILEIQSKGVIR